MPLRQIASRMGTIKRTIKTFARITHVPWASKARMIRDLRRLGVREGGILLVHSSLSSLGYVPGGSQTVISALLSVIGPGGTLVFPTHSWEEMAAGNRVFDARFTRSCVGVLSEQFRHMPGVMRSLHPTHSIAVIGPLAEDLTRFHQDAETPCGAGTPYLKILNDDGQILFLGVDLEHNTSYHTVEAIAGTPHLMNESADKFKVIDQNGREEEVTVFRHRGGIPRRYAELEPLFVKHGMLNCGRVGQAHCLLLAGKPFLHLMKESLQSDPDFLLASHKTS